MSANIILAINRQIASAQKILLVSHCQPDGDALGSALALRLYLNRSGKAVTVFITDPPPRYFRFLPGVEEVSADRRLLENRWDLVITLDAGDWNHLAINPAELKSAAIANIDHHISNQYHGDVNLVETTASSTCEIIYRFLVFNRQKIDRDIATCLLCGILTDTGGLLNSATTVEALAIAAALINHGAKIGRITRPLSQNKTLAGLRLWGAVLARLREDVDRQIAFTYLKDEEYQNYRVAQDELDGLINFLNVLTDVALVALFRIGPDRTVVSLRTTGDQVDVSKIAKFYGGGGHRKAAGFTLDLTVDAESDLSRYLKNIER